MLHWLAERMSALGEWAQEFVVAALICMAVYPVLRIGWHVRNAVRSKLRGYHGEQVRKSVCYAFVGVSVVAIIGITLKVVGPPKWWIAYAIGVSALALLGSFGYILVPEEFEE